MENPYDQVPYPSYPYPQTHPDRLGTVATLFGLDPVPLGGARVLEVGCAAGGNLLPIAINWPGSQCLGIDLSSKEIAHGQTMLKELGLGNAELRCMNILDVSPELGVFDYILVHGIYSWVPQEVQSKILQICKQNLSPRGVAYVSYNTYPGWHMMKILRDSMLFHARNESTPGGKTQKAREMLDLITRAAGSSKDRYRNIWQAFTGLQDVAKHRGKAESYHDSSLLHDELAGINDPVYFHEFITRASDRGLQYLSEADLPSVFLDNFPEEIRQPLRAIGKNVVETEQYMDFFRNRMFRQTLLVHAEQTVKRMLEPAVVKRFELISRAKATIEGEQGKFESGDGLSFNTSHPLTLAAMELLTRAYPESRPFDELLKQARDEVGDDKATPADEHTLASNILKIYCSSLQLVDLRLDHPPVTASVSDTPATSPIARLQARSEPFVTNFWHERVRVDDAMRYLIQVLDGHTDRAGMCEKLTELAMRGAMVLRKEDKPISERDEIRLTFEQNIDRFLERLARSALLRA